MAWQQDDGGADGEHPEWVVDGFGVVVIDALTAAMLRLITGQSQSLEAGELIEALLSVHHGDVTLDAEQCEHIALLLARLETAPEALKLADFFFAQLAHAVFGQPR